MAHYQKNLIRMIRKVSRKNKLGGFTSSSYLALVPKEARPSTFSWCWPICLCNSSYKIITKILANWIKPILPSLISENQGGFVLSRQIFNNIMIVQECMHSSVIRKENSIIIKLYMKNIFDRVNISFLSSILKKFGFSSEIIEIIRACTIGPWIAPLINGRPSELFQISWGLRQWCPLSPFIYIIMPYSSSKSLESVGEITY